jgi:hypothetical protein
MVLTLKTFIIQKKNECKMIMKYVSLCILTDKPIIIFQLLVLLSCLWLTKYSPCLVILHICCSNKQNTSYKPIKIPTYSVYTKSRSLVLVISFWYVQVDWTE